MEQNVGIRTVQVEYTPTITELLPIELAYLRLMNDLFEIIYQNGYGRTLALRPKVVLV